MERVPKGKVFRTADEKARIESRNGVNQIRFVLSKVPDLAVSKTLTPDLILELQRIAITQVYRCAGYFREDPIRLDGSAHEPPPAEDVPALVDELCAYVNSSWEDRSAYHLGAYVLWRLNWIHPFNGGNGRTSRAASYLVLSAKLDMILPAGTNSRMIPEQIDTDYRQDYFAALRSADDAWRSGHLDVSDLEEMLSSALAEQLIAIHGLAELSSSDD